MDVWSYSGKRVAIVGCFSGMGEACARELVRLGAETHGFDIRESPVPMASFKQVDLKDRASIDAAVASVPGQIDALFNCAGLPGTFPALDVLTVNFIGMRYWTEAWLPKIKKPGGAIATISSNAAHGLAHHMTAVMEFVGNPDWDSATAWAKAHGEQISDAYTFSKEAINVWTMREGVRLAKQGVRINCTCPSPTATPMMKEFVKAAPQKVLDVFAEPVGRHSTPEEQAYPLIFLNSDAAGFISGHPLMVDGGFIGGTTTGEIDLQKLMAAAFASA
jgi:NAD(P)-dependent dehydrogenase (short-subunit alcohol dehydrogenase family)